MITPRQLTDIARIAAAEGVQPDTLTRLRRIYPGVYFASCFDDDINNVAPALQHEAGINLYLVDGRHLCLRLTEELRFATGVVLAVATECLES